MREIGKKNLKIKIKIIHKILETGFMINEYSKNSINPLKSIFNS